MAQETLDKAGRLAEEAQNASIKLDVVTEQVRHLLEEHHTINPKMLATLRKAKAEHGRKLQRLIRALDGEKR